VIGISSCDFTTAPKNPLAQTPGISNIEINPSEVIFSPQDGFTDTTITLEIGALIDNIGSDTPRFTISNKRTGEFVGEGELSPSDSQNFNFSADYELETATTAIEDFMVNVFFTESQDIYAQTELSVIGFANNPPEILSAQNPEEVTIPTGGETVDVFFTAKVTDPDGQDNVDRVLIEFINEDGTRLVPEPNQLLDNGLNNSGDQVAGDSVFTIAFTITSSNTPNRRKVEYFAIDKAGLSSDTVETNFNIVE
jgi:hypothetical protein